MFFPPKSKTIVVAAALALLATTDLSAQSASQYQQRVRAMQAARARAAAPMTEQTAQIPVTAQPNQESQQVQQVQYSEPVPDTATGRRPAANQVRTTRGPNRRYVAPHLRMAQLSETPIVNGAAPVAGNAPLTGAGQMLPTPMTNTPVLGNIVNGTPMVGSQNAAPMIGDSMGQVFDSGCMDGSCGNSVYGGVCGDDCSDRGGCPPGMLENCWLNGFGAFLYNGEYFAGANAFRGPGFNIGNDTVDDCNFGFYGGVNFGIPLCRLTCGLLSGQIGIRSVNTNFHGTSMTPESRDQLFVTAGVYRRVDYGLQGGVVADFLNDQWFTESDTVQVRADLGWVYGNGTTMGFRAGLASSDDTSAGIFNGNAFAGLTSTVVDQYRFYVERPICYGGNYDFSLGWSENDDFIAAIDFDIPIGQRFAMQSGFTYYLNDLSDANSGAIGGMDQDSWNLYVGLTWRPRSSNWYRFYDRPLFDVADNGSMLVRRQ